jgi:predicted CXXCH cytochrome family protein
MEKRVAPMTKNSMKLHMWIWLLAVVLLQLGSGVAFAQKQPAAAKASFTSWIAPVKGDAGKYAGTKSCLEGDCHTSRALQMSKTVHSRNDVAGMSTQTSCEACHGPGKEHTDREKEADRTKVKDPEAAKLIFSFKGSPAVNSASCLACHGTSKEHDLYSRSEHKLQAVACNDCHEPHLVFREKNATKVERSLPEAQFVALPKLPEERRWLNESLLRTTQTELCVSCHRSVEAQFALPQRHRVLEGAMKCTDCHNTHGTLTKPLLQKASVNDTCTSCHAEKRGPFVYEHASVKVEGCTYCHSPHGSVNQHRLKRGESRFLCVSCHAQHGNLSYQWSGPCTRCHVTIHGSNTSEFFVK